MNVIVEIEADKGAEVVEMDIQQQPTVASKEGNKTYSAHMQKQKN